MPLIPVILTLLARVVAGSIIARASGRFLPVPLAQIALGGLIASVVDLRIAVAPETFLLLFIAPLLFLDGWRIPREGLADDKWVIAALALGLVLFTVLGVGLFVHWLIPAMPLPVAFVRGADEQDLERMRPPSVFPVTLTAERTSGRLHRRAEPG